MRVGARRDRERDERLDDQVSWRVRVLRERFDLDDEDRILEVAHESQAREGWDLVVCLTDLPRRVQVTIPPRLAVYIALDPAEEGTRMRKQWPIVIGVMAVLLVVAATTAAAKPSGGTGRQIVERTITLTTPPGGDFLTVNELVTCPAGTASVNGGWAWVTPPVGETTSRRLAGGPDGTNWRVIFNTWVAVDSTNDFTLWAICVNA